MASRTPLWSSHSVKPRVQFYKDRPKLACRGGWRSGTAIALPPRWALSKMEDLRSAPLSRCASTLAQRGLLLALYSSGKSLIPSP
jgi:hypothetical protein